jgi:hypothetical protein
MKGGNSLHWSIIISMYMQNGTSRKILLLYQTIRSAVDGIRCYVLRNTIPDCNGDASLLRCEVHRSGRIRCKSDTEPDNPGCDSQVTLVLKGASHRECGQILIYISNLNISVFNIIRIYDNV